MSERTATCLVFVGGIALMCIAILGLGALGANPQTVFLGFFVPLVLGSYGISRVTMHYAALRRRRDR
jgi:hypothetical protein